MFCGLLAQLCRSSRSSRCGVFAGLFSAPPSCSLSRSALLDVDIQEVEFQNLLHLVPFDDVEWWEIHFFPPEVNHQLFGL